MPDTFVKIASVTVGSGGASSIDFTSIPSTYTDLCLKMSTRTTRSTGNANITMVRFNSNTSGYTFRVLLGDGSSPSSFNQTALFTDAGFGGYGDQDNNTTSTFSSHELYVPNYAGSNNKSFSIDAVQENNATTGLASMAANLWSNTAAITSITLSPFEGFNYKQYSTAVLYGIKNS